MIVRITDLALLTTELLVQQPRLRLVCASEEATARDTIVSEGLVVASSIEGGGGDVVAATLEPLAVKCLNFCASWWAGEVVFAAVAVEGGKNIVGRGDHVEVEVELNLVELARGVVESFDVVGGAKEAELLATPPAEADSVVRAVV